MYCFNLPQTWPISLSLMLEEVCKVWRQAHAQIKIWYSLNSFLQYFDRSQKSTLLGHNFRCGASFDFKLGTKVCLNGLNKFTKFEVKRMSRSNFRIRRLIFLTLWLLNCQIGPFWPITSVPLFQSTLNLAHKFVLKVKNFTRSFNSCACAIQVLTPWKY